jgi:hypothetical protein
VGARRERVVDGPGTILPEIARVLQFAPQGEDDVLDGRGGPVDLFGERRPIVPLNLIQSPIARTMRAVARAHAVSLSTVQWWVRRRSGPDLSHHRTSLGFPAPSFLPIVSAPQGFCLGIIVTERLWQLGDREALAPGRLSAYGGVPIAVEKRDGVSSRWIGDHQP